MVDETTTPAQDATPAPAPVPEAQGTPAISTKDIEGKTPDEIVKIVAEKSEALGATKKQLEDTQNWIKSTKPYMDAIVADPELTKQVEEAYKKSVAPPETTTPAPTEETARINDTRRALVNDYTKSFEQDHGLDKLTGDDKKNMNVRVGQELMELLDPTGTKNYNDIMDNIPLDKVKPYLEKAYRLATMDEQINKAKETGQVEAQSGANGIMSSIPSSSPSDDDVSITPFERQAAAKMGVTPEKWLERKKQINARAEER